MAIAAADAAAAVAWAAAEPRSTAARIGLAQLNLRAGWSARGEGLAGETSPEQWLGLALGVSQANRAARGVIGADAVAITDDDDPQSYQVLLDIAMGRGNRRQMDALYARAAAAHPSWCNYYSFRANYLQPKWHGELGELPEYLRSLLQTPGGDDR